MKCPNEKCKAFNKGMANLSPYNNEYTHLICPTCNWHFEGAKGEEKWYNSKEWQNRINEFRMAFYNKPYSVFKIKKKINKGDL